MLTPPRITDWVRNTYPKPIVDPEWLDACLAWIAEELHLNDFDSQGDEIITHVNSQLLSSDLRDSMLAGTGFPLNIDSAENVRLRGHILVQIQAMTEIGHSAFSLQNVQQTRIDRADLAGLTAEDDEDEGPIPKFPRSMLRFDLSDGSRSVKAIEYKKLPELELGVTPLGYKMILKDVPIRQGIAFLEPSNVELKGYMTEELEANREADFARSLRMRLGQPEPESDEPHDTPENNDGVPRQLPPPSGAAVPAARPPLREVTVEASHPRGPPPRHLPREELEPPTRRRVPSSNPTLAQISTRVVSPYFSNATTSSATLAPSSNLSSVRLPPVHHAPLPTRATGEDSSEFSDDIPIDDTFLRELDAVEQAATSAFQHNSRNAGQSFIGSNSPGVANSTEQSEVIVIDSDSDDKENLAPNVQRRVRRRLETPGDDDSEVIVIE